MGILDRIIFWWYTHKHFPMEVEYIKFGDVGGLKISYESFSVDPVVRIRVHVIAGVIIGEVVRENRDTKFYIGVREFGVGDKKIARS